MSRTRRMYTDIIGGTLTSDGQEWDQANAPDMTSGHTTIDYSITIGTGKSAETFTELTIWQNGVISLGAPTAAQISFMGAFAGSQSLNEFPGFYISAGYTNESGQAASDGGYDSGYGVEIASGEIDFTAPDGQAGRTADAIPVLRITWGQTDGGDIFADKQVILTPTDFTIGDTGYDGEGAGFGFGRVSVNGAAGVIAPAISYSADYFAYVKSDFYGTGESDILIAKQSGEVVTGAISGFGLEQFSLIGGLGPEWSFHGTGDYLGEGYSQFLIASTGGAVMIGDASSGTAVYTQVASLGSEWTFRESGDFLNHGKSDFLLENTIGQVFVGEVASGQAHFTQVAALGAEWTFVGAGDFLGDGHDQFLIENTLGQVDVGAVGSNNQTTYAQIAGLGQEWKFVGSGDFLGDGKADFLIENTLGQVDVGEVGANNQASYTQVAGLGQEWSFVGTGDFLAEGHDQFLIENTSGDVDIADYFGGQIHYTPVAGLGSEWAFHM